MRRDHVIRAARRALANLPNTPKGKVTCGHRDHGEVCFVECVDGVIRKVRYTCPRCRRFVPYCFGAADVFSRVCDDCYGQLRDVFDHVTALQDVSFEVDVPDDLYAPLHGEVMRWVDEDITSFVALEVRLGLRREVPDAAE